MEHSAIIRSTLDRRSFLSWSSTLALAGTATAFMPAGAWARAGRVALGQARVSIPVDRSPCG